MCGTRYYSYSTGTQSTNVSIVILPLCIDDMLKLLLQSKNSNLKKAISPYGKCICDQILENHPYGRA